MNAPQWMLDGEVLAITCAVCNGHMRRVGNDEFCLDCWVWRTNLTAEHVARHMALQAKRIATLDEVDEDDETGGYRLYEDKAFEHGDWAGVMSFKWRMAFLASTGERFPMEQRIDLTEKEAA